MKIRHYGNLSPDDVSPLHPSPSDLSPGDPSLPHLSPAQIVTRPKLLPLI
jgi:hypothetical protein